jgi:hypothetical protein
MDSTDAPGNVQQPALPCHLPPNAGPTIELIAALDAALIKARAKYGDLTKDADNPYFNSKYLSLDKLLASVAPALGGQGLSLSSSYQPTAAGFVVTTTLSHVSGGYRTSTFPVLDVSKSQAVGSSGTYAMRYNLTQLLCVAAETDDDGNAADGLKGKKSDYSSNGTRNQPAARPAPMGGNALF